MRKALIAGFLTALMCAVALLSGEVRVARAQDAPVTAQETPAAAASPSPEVSPSPALVPSPVDSPAPVASPSPTDAATPPTAPSPAPPAAPSPAPEGSPSPAPPFGVPETAPKIPGAQQEKPPEAPLVKSIEVEGNSEVPTADILQVVTSRIGEPFDKDRVQNDLRNIYEMGYFTDVKVRTEPFLSGVQVIYQVFENPKVRQIGISGNTVVATDKLRGLMETKEGKILNTKTLFADITVINRYYDNELGLLLEPTHVTGLKFTPEGDLNLTITEGVAVKEVKIVGNTVVPTSQLEPLVKLKPGELFNQFTMKEDADRLAKFYESKDYIIDNIRPSVNKETGVVTYEVVEARVEGIRIEGNTRTKAWVIKRLMRTKIGAVLKRTRLQRDLERLNSSGFFEAVNIEPEPGSEAGQVVLVLKVKEQKTGLATLGLGYSGGGTGALRSGITGAISFSERNLGGRGQSASVSWQAGVNVSSYGVSYFDPVFNDQQDSVGFSFFHSDFTDLQQPVSSSGTVTSFALYDDRRTGYSVTYGKYLSEEIRGFLTFKKEHVSITQAANSQFVPFGLGVGDSNSVTFSALQDTRDDLFNPHKGTYGNAAVTGSGGPLGGIFDYTKVQVEVRHYIPLFRDHTLALRGWAGMANGRLPTSEVFFLGGADTLRAYQSNAFIGNRFFVANAEYRFPIANLKLLNGAVFADVGSAWFGGQPSKIFSDVGVGLRIVFPSLGLGVIRIDFAVGERGTRSTIGLGQTF